MASDRSDTQSQVLVRMDPRFGPKALWAAQATYTQAGPQPGVPAPQGDYDMVLEATGSQSAAKELRILSNRGGHAVPGGGGFAWKYDADAATAYRGWDVPNVITSWEAVVWNTASATATRDPHAITLDNDIVVVVYEENTTNPDVQVRTRTTAGVWSSEILVYSAPNTPGSGYVTGPCLLKLPSGRILCYYFVQNAVGTLANVQMKYSDDDGATWTLGNYHCLSTDIVVRSAAAASGIAGYDTQRIRAAYKGGQVVMFIGLELADTDLAFQSAVRQYASDDAGTSFQFVVESDNTAHIAHSPDVVTVKGKFLFGITGRGNGTIEGGSVGRLDDAFASFEAATYTDINADISMSAATIRGLGFVAGDGELTLWVDDDDVVYTASRHSSVTSPTGDCFIMRSFDGGEVWADMGEGTTIGSTDISVWWHSGDVGTYPVNLAATQQRGRTLMLHNWVAAPGNEDTSLGCAYLGGYSSVTMPGIKAFANDDDRSAWTTTYLPFDLPGDLTPWTASGGGGAESLDSPGLLVLTTTGADDISYTTTPTSTQAQGVMCRFVVRASSGGAVTTDAIAVRLRLAESTNDYDISIRFASSGAIRVHDNDPATAAAIGADITTTTTTDVDFLVALDNGKVSTWYRAYSTSSDRSWTPHLSGATVANDTATPSAANLITFGNIATATASSKWTELHFCVGATTGTKIAAGQTNPDDLFSRTYSRFALSVDDGVRIASVDGPAVVGQTYHVDTRYDYAIENIFPSESRTPRKTWRSTGKTAIRIPLVFDSTLLGTVDSAMGSDLIAIGLTGINWQLGSLQNWTSGAWATLATIDASSGMATLEYTRHGNVVIPQSGPTDKPYLFENEAAGWTFIAQDISGDAPRKVLWNSEGVWDSATSSTYAQLALSDVVGTETASSTGTLVPTSVVILVNALDIRAAALSLVIDAQETVDGYFTIGTMVLGPAWVAGIPADRERNIETQRNWARSQTPDGVSHHKVLGPQGRVVEIAWTEPVYIADTVGTGPDPDYVMSSAHASAKPVAARFGTPHNLEGLARQLEGAPIFYCPSVPKATSSSGAAQTKTMNRRANHMYGFLDGPVRIETTTGLAESTTEGELVRVARIPIREEV